MNCWFELSLALVPVGEERRSYRILGWHQILFDFRWPVLSHSEACTYAVLICWPEPVDQVWQASRSQYALPLCLTNKTNIFTLCLTLKIKLLVTACMLEIHPWAII